MGLASLKQTGKPLFYAFGYLGVRPTRTFYADLNFHDRQDGGGQLLPANLIYPTEQARVGLLLPQVTDDVSIEDIHRSALELKVSRLKH